ncbi:MAG: NAD-dependent malic enzyme [Sedimentisphaeraceae bacterium JB056]
MAKLYKSLQERYKATNVFTLECKILDKPGMLSQATGAISSADINIDQIKTLRIDGEYRICAITVFCRNMDDVNVAKKEIEAIDGLELVNVIDEVLEIHRRGTIETKSRVEIKDLTDLRMVYTPGVAAACKKIVDNPEAAWEMTGICDRVAIVSDGTAVLGLGDIGPSASLPVMEGKAAIFAEFVGISGVPIVIDSKDPDTIIENIRLISNTFGAIQLEDIAAPACFEIEDRLRKMLDIPVFHDDQHATATVVLAALINALKIVGKKEENCKAIVIGAGAAGYAITKILLKFGIEDIVVYDAGGAIYRGRKEMMNPYIEKLAEITNKDNISGSLEEGFKDRDIFVGVARPNLVSKEMISSMADKAIVFPLSNPVGEITVEEAQEAGAAVTADGRTINNALAFPGLFRGALDVKAGDITPEMQMAAADTLAKMANEGMLLPDMMDKEVHKAVSKAVALAAK